MVENIIHSSETRWFNTVDFLIHRMNEDSHKDLKLGDILKTAQKKPFRKTRMDAVASPDGSIGVEKQIDQQVLVFGAHFGYFFNSLSSSKQLC